MVLETVEHLVSEELVAPVSWRDQAECRGADPDLFFPSVLPGLKRKVGYARKAEARAICAQCPVLEECLRWAVETRPVEGIWAGLTPRERGIRLGE